MVKPAFEDCQDSGSRPFWTDCHPRTRMPPRMSLPCVNVIIADGVMSFGMKAAEELGIPGVRFWTASACGMMGYLSYSDLKKRGICPFKGDDFGKDGTLDNTV
ncbi:hypothetical protein QQ045_012328 [Rhodiola kirilowii]